MDILPYSPDTISAVLKDTNDGLNVTDSRRLLLNVDDAADWCIFCVEVRNTYGLPFEVSFERVQPGERNRDALSPRPLTLFPRRTNQLHY